MSIKEIESIAVIGLGTMGPGILQTFAAEGFEVYGYDNDSKAFDTCRKIVKSNLDTLVEFNRIKKRNAEKALNRIQYNDSIEKAVQSASLVIECVSENKEIKKQVYNQISNYASNDCIIWSNTSTLNVFDLLPIERTPYSVIAHWFAPPHIIPLVEVVKNSKNMDSTIETTLDLLKKINKIPIILEKYIPGFVINRILRILGREAFFLLDNEYISAEDLDLAVKASIAPRMMVLGLVQRYDFTGLDLSARNLLDKDFFDPPMDNHPASLHQKLEQGHLGVKSGRGFYDYTDRDLTDILQKRDRYLLQVIQSLDFCLEKKRLV